jgi:hypothetical protein
VTLPLVSKTSDVQRDLFKLTRSTLGDAVVQQVGIDRRQPANRLARR